MLVAVCMFWSLLNSAIIIGMWTPVSVYIRISPCLVLLATVVMGCAVTYFRGRCGLFIHH